jgi:hypothetical protein
MTTLVRLIFAFAFSSAMVAASADERTSAINDPSRSGRVSAALASQLKLHATRAPTANAPKDTAAVTSATPALPIANSYRTYPPSCLADPLPDTPSGPTYSATVNLAAYDSTTNPASYTLEGVTITIWRVACSSASLFNSATLMRIKRQAIYEGDQSIYPLFPVIRISQGSAGYNDTDSRNLIRVAVEPNTVISDTLAESPIIFSTTYVLENYPSSAAGTFDFNLPFGLRFDNLFASNNQFTINTPLYNPNGSTYPAAFQNVPISGYMSTNWYDPTADGEGIVLQVYERIGDSSNLVVAFSWSAYDPSGIPFWLGGQVDIARGAKTANAPMFYRTGGGFAGNNGAADPPIAWGTSSVSFPDCNTMTLTYASNPGLPAGVPSGSGTRTWLRIANVNGLPCE